MVNSSLSFKVMLRNLQKISYEEFLDVLQEGRDQLKSTDSSMIVGKKLLTTLTKIFQEKIITLTSDELDLVIASRWQSLQTEISRTFRLLTTDMMFLSSSIQSTTAQARLAKVTEHLDKLIVYCQMILKLDQEL